MNRPPRIVPESLKPDPTNGPKLFYTNCPQYSFQASLTDPDPDDTLYWRYFIDYHNNRYEELLEEATPLPPDPSRMGSPRVVNFTVDPQDQRFGTDSSRFSEPHTVELLVADRPFFPGERTVEEDGLIDSFIWTIQLDGSPDPTCVEGWQ